MTLKDGENVAAAIVVMTKLSQKGLALKIELDVERNIFTAKKTVNVAKNIGRSKITLLMLVLIFFTNWPCRNINFATNRFRLIQ